MIERLYIVRHGEAMPHGTPGMSDDDRPLTPEGEKRFRQAAEGFARLELALDKIVTSPLPRALRTAELLAEATGLTLNRLRVENVLSAGSDGERIAGWVERELWSQRGAVALVGHNPWCEELLAQLVTGRPDDSVAVFKKGSIAALRATGNQWSLEWLATPKLLRKLA